MKLKHKIRQFLIKHISTLFTISTTSWQCKECKSPEMYQSAHIKNTAKFKYKKYRCNDCGYVIYTSSRILKNKPRFKK